MRVFQTIVAIFIIVLISVSFGTSFAEEMVQPLDGITRPVSDVELSFMQPGKIQTLLVAKGDIVEPGDVLVTLDDEIEQIQKKILIDRSRNMVPIDLAKVELTQSKKNLENVTRAHAKGATSAWEVEHAAFGVDTALLNLKVREFERSQDMLKLKSLLGQIERLSIRSPVKGIVEDIMIEPGETIQAMVPVVRLVETDPLIIELAVPVEQAVELEVGQGAVVTFLDTTVLDADITHIATIADAAATTLTVTLLVKNSRKRPAGERVRVVFVE